MRKYSAYFRVFAGKPHLGFQKQTCVQKFQAVARQRGVWSVLLLPHPSKCFSVDAHFISCHSKPSPRARHTYLVNIRACVSTVEMHFSIHIHLCAFRYAHTDGCVHVSVCIGLDGCVWDFRIRLFFRAGPAPKL